MYSVILILYKLKLNVSNFFPGEETDMEDIGEPEQLNSQEGTAHKKPAHLYYCGHPMLPFELLRNER